LSLETIIADAGTLCAVEVDSTAGVPTQTAMGGASRTDADWVTVADSVPCLVEPTGGQQVEVNSQKQYQTKAIIYFAADPVPEGMSPRHRIRITSVGAAGKRIAGTWAIDFVDDPIPSGDHLEVSCTRIGIP